MSFNKVIHKQLWCCVFAIMLGILLNGIALETASAGTAQVPLFLTVEVSPNIVFVIDDSGSMHFETMPETVSMWTFGGTEWWHRGVFYMFPAPGRIYGGGSYDYWESSTYRGSNTHNVPRFDATNKWAAYFRSHHNNPMYYNPEVRYRPWVDKDNGSWPDAVPSAAYHNPANTAKGSRNLTSDNSQSACWIKSTASTSSSNSDICSQGSLTFYPATYFQYDGSGDVYDPSSYTRIEIKSGNAPFAGGLNRTDCADPSACTYDEEIQNFANWYTYHRSRVLAARAGIGRAFASQDDLIRVGFGTINASSALVDGITSSGTMVMGVRDFSGTDRENFFNLLYGRDFPLAGTPLRQGLDDVGQYYCRTDERGPWNSTPGSAGGEDLTCRNSYTILMTDGYWNDGESYDARDSARRANVDNQDGPTIDNPIVGSEDFKYSPEAPYMDDWSNTLADVAMYYWNHDLRSDLANKVPVSLFNEAYWQNMVTFGVGLGVAGSLDPVVDLPALKAGTKTWSDPNNDSTGKYKIDDLWHAALNSRGNFFSAMDPDEFAQKLGALLTSLVERKNGTAAAIATNSTRLVDTTLIYQARFDSSDWSGEIIAYHINSDGSVGAVEWDTDQTGKIPAHGSRKIYTWDGSTGVELAWANLSTSQKTDLQNGGTEQEGIDRMNWLRGDQSKEEDKSGGYLRTRERILGDIVNSDPLVVGGLDFQYDRLPTGTDGRDTYAAFRTTNKSRAKTLYIGGNDGMLHAFDAQTGMEKFAYMPAGVFANLADLTSPTYTHQYFVDGSPNVGDAYISNQWKTVLVGTLGAGGKRVFALDVTDPDSFDGSKVLWEFTDADLGYTIGQPSVARMANGQWAAIFGNGYESTNDRAFLFIVNLETGALIRKIDTGAGDTVSPNGLATPAMLASSQQTISYAYAGDTLGNLWKFDLTHATLPSQWIVDYKGDPLFLARNSSAQVQPITAPLEIGKHPSSGYMIYFGTGKYFETDDNVVGASPEVQSFYGIWDNGSRISVTDRSTLVAQTIIAQGLLYSGVTDELRVVSANSVDWSSKRGWYLDLMPPSPGTAEGERVVSAPLLRHGRVIFSTLIPLTDPCAAGGTSWLMELDALGGGRLDTSAFDVNNDGKVDSNDMVTITVDGEDILVPASGQKSNVGIIKTPAVITDGHLEYKYSGGSEGGISVIREKGSANDMIGRRSWRELQ